MHINSTERKITPYSIVCRIDYMTKELTMRRSEIEEALTKCLYNNEMACYLMLARNCGIYNNRQVVAEVQPYIIHLLCYATLFSI